MNGTTPDNVMLETGYTVLRLLLLTIVIIGINLSNCKSHAVFYLEHREFAVV